MTGEAHWLTLIVIVLGLFLVRGLVRWSQHAH